MIQNLLDIIQMLLAHPGEMYVMNDTTAFTMVDNQAYIITGEGFASMTADEMNSYIQITALKQRLG